MEPLRLAKENPGIDNTMLATLYVGVNPIVTVVE